MKRAVVGLIMAFLPIQALAQDAAVPEFRYSVTRDVDFFGSDLDPLFDTSLDACIRACSAQTACTAFTFNTRSNACFPKSGVTDRQAYAGAVSAAKLPTAPAVLAGAEARAATLDFLSKGDLARAAEMGRDVGFEHRTDGQPLDVLIDSARAAEAQGRLEPAMRWTGAAVALSDRADLWTDYARLLLAVPRENDDQRRQDASRALPAAINGYLRAETGPGRATALGLMAEALERVGRGRDMIPALRLALSEGPRQELEAMLDDAIGKYGFRVVDTTVESDSAAPRICAQFSEELVKAGTDYEPFLRTEVTGLVVQPQGNQLCVDGVEHGQRYRLTFRAGLPAASGETLQKDVEITQYVRDRGASVRFPGRAYVLPKAADAALPVETVNLSELNLVLRRVSDRNILRAIQDDFFSRPLNYWQDETFSTDIAEEIWTGSAEVQSELNRDMTTRLPLGEAIADQPLGIYALSARIPGKEPYDDPGATQWFVLSDLGLSSYEGAEGLDVVVRGLSDADAREGVEVTLVSRANAVLGTATTGPDGWVAFAPGLTRGTGGAEPALVLARAGDDLNFIPLTDPAFDLSDRGVAGRPPAGPVDVFLATDRGAYRAGETIHVTALARDDEAEAVEGLPLIAILSRPDGVEYSRRISDGGHAGGHVFALPVGKAVPRGSWKIEIKGDPDAAPLATETVLVEDFIPERIDFTLALSETPVVPGSAPVLDIDARYLFGAPGADLSVEGNVQLAAATDIAGWAGYTFGRHDDSAQPNGTFFSGERTGPDGKASVTLDLPEPPAADRPLELTATVRLADGSARPVERRITAPVLPQTPVIGIKPMFEDLGEATDATFQVIGLSETLVPQAMEVEWTLNRVQTRYQWYQLYGNWEWEPVTRRTRVSTGSLSLGQEPLTVTAPVDWGQYELVVERTDGIYAASSVSFEAGWYTAGDSAATPDKLEMSLDRAAYDIGDTARLRVVAREAGTALVAVMSNRVISRQAVEVAEGETVIPLEVAEDWGTGAYVTATVLSPMDVAAGHNPTRSLGIAHAAIDPGDKALEVSIDAPEVVRPRGAREVTITVGNAGEDTWVTLAAVDLGILNLTGFDSPDPEGHYFGQRQLGVEIRDVYGRLIDGMNGAMGTVRSGGDGDQGARLQSPPPTEELVALFSGPLEVGPDGTARVTLDLPAFNGTVRLMAIAWSPDAVGQAERDMIVRDPVVLTASVPRFLAPGDNAQVRLDITHADGPSGEMRLALIPRGEGLSLGAVPATVDLEQQAKASLTVPVSASLVGDPSFELVLTTPDGQELRQTLRLPVRANDPVVAETRRFTLAAGDTFAFTPDVFAGYRAGTASALLSAGPLATLNAPRLLDMLDRYPYGCTEQVTSQALPLLYLSSVAETMKLGTKPALDDRIEAAIRQVIARQAPNGAFGLWRPESGDFWLDAYVGDFLSRARAEGHDVPQLAYRMAMDNLRNRVNYAPDFDKGGQDIAYALLVLAREGAAAMADLRYYADVKAEAFATPLAVAQLGAALAAYGDQTRADALFSQAGQMLAAEPTEPPVWRADYGTPRRDTAAVLALATEAGSRAIDPAVLTARLAQPDPHPSTQEAAWTLMAAHALISTPEQSGLRVNGAAVTGPFVQVLEDDAPQGGLAIATADGRATDITLTTLGVPEVPPAAGGTGYGIERAYYAMDGQPLGGDSFAQGDRFVTVLTVTPFEGAEARLMIDDPLPAGVEIDNPNLLRSGDVGALDWLQLTEARHAEFRSDRFLAQVDLRETQTVRVAYVGRAVTPGSFHHPAASVEDMYRPTYRARTATGRVEVTE